MEQQSFVSALEQICEEKGISKEKAIETVELALAAAYKKEYACRNKNIRVKLDPKSGEMKIYQIKTVVDESMIKSEEEIAQEKEEKGIDSEPENKQEQEDDLPEEEKKVRFNQEKHVMADKIKEDEDIPKKKKEKEYQVGEEIKIPLKITHDFGRIAAQTAKQVIIQRIREAERDAIFEEYKDKEGQIASGIIQRIEGNTVFLDIGKATGVLFPEEQISHERYRLGQRIKVYLAEVQKDSRGPTIALSRSHPQMISQLFYLEVPEIAAGSVEIKAVAREAGSRSKIAVSSTEEKIDPIGSMIGQKGTRVQAVINELNGEKIDIVEWSENPVQYITNALSPAKVIDVRMKKEKKEAEVVVPEEQLSLAIGVKGQNVRLAAKLTDWKIDIKPQEESPKEKKGEKGKEEKKTKLKGKEEKPAQTEKKEKKTSKKKATKKETEGDKEEKLKKKSKNIAKKNK